MVTETKEELFLDIIEPIPEFDFFMSLARHKRILITFSDTFRPERLEVYITEIEDTFWDGGKEKWLIKGIFGSGYRVFRKIYESAENCKRGEEIGEAIIIKGSFHGHYDRKTGKGRVQVMEWKRDPVIKGESKDYFPT